MIQLDKTINKIFADLNFVVCFLALKFCDTDYSIYLMLTIKAPFETAADDNLELFFRENKI